MAVNETIVTGRKFRKLIDAANKQWQRISFWHKASDCEFDDGDTAETKVGAIKGITTDLNTTTTGYAADMTTVASLNSSLGGMTFGIDSDGNYGYIKAGADTVTPFKSGVNLSMIYNTEAITKNETATYIFTENYNYILVSWIYMNDTNKLSFTTNGTKVFEFMQKQGQLPNVCVYKDIKVGDSVSLKRTSVAPSGFVVFNVNLKSV